jgi:hypothetical protein
MPSQLENTLNQAVAKIVDGIEDFSTLSVTTKFVIVGAPEEAPAVTLPEAVTTMEPDGDTSDTVPLRWVGGAEGEEPKLKVNNELHNLHVQNVARAIAYRKDLIDTFMDAAKSIIGG